MFTPRIEQSYNLDRHYDPDPVRSEAQKVKALHKREMKGALRELRKDSAFLAGQKLQAQLASDKEYQTKIKRVFGMLSAEQGEMKREKRIRNK